MSLPDEQEPDDFLHINLNRLHKEWVIQPRLYHKYADLLVTARRDYEQARNNRDFVAAELEIAIRKDPDRFDLDKVTDRSVEKRVLISKKYQKANEEVLETHRRVNSLEAVIKSLEHRKSALEDLVRLRLSDFWSEPRVPKGTDRSEVNDKLRHNR